MNFKNWSLREWTVSVVIVTWVVAITYLSIKYGA